MGVQDDDLAQTFERNKEGLWLGPAMTGDPLEDLREVAPNHPCVCGSGQAFDGCCKGDVERRAGDRSRQIVDAAIDAVVSQARASLPGRQNQR